MSYDLLVFNVDRALTTQEADKLMDVVDASDAPDWLVPTPRVEALAADLLRAYPPEDGMPTWSCEPDITAASAYVSMPFSHIDELGAAVIAASRRHGLAIYDPQARFLYLPERLVESTEATLESPHLLGAMPASPELIRELVPRLVDREDPYAILSFEPERYMQTLWTEQGYVLEHREGDASRHFAAASPLPWQTVIEAMTSYARGSWDWALICDFERIDM